MPVEIKELVIRTVVSTGDLQGFDDDGNALPEAADPAGVGDREAIVQECVRQVLRIMARTKER